MRNSWEVWEKALSAEQCDAIIERAALYPADEATVGFSDSKRSDADYRSSRIRWVDALREAEIVSWFMAYVQSSNRTNFGADIVAPFDIQFTEYHASNNGHYDWHQDVWLESPRPYDRKLSVVVQLSSPEDYTGGTFEFFGIQNPAETFAARGSLLIFPSFLQHCVRPVTSGIRRSLVTWVEGPRWR